MKKLLPIAHTLEGLAGGELRSSDLVESCLDAIADPSGEGARTFTRVFSDSARSKAKEFDTHRTAGALAGLPISVKDLFDVAGEPTTAGSVVLAQAPPAKADAVVVARLRAAGAIVMGHTNMTEFAFSGLGVNPHYGTPSNPYDRASRRIPGGSSSGAAVSVTDGMAYAALGSDTGGSVRIPAALCGLTGFKPTARRIPLDGALPLSSTLDSIGPLAPTVACCARIDAVLAGIAQHPIRPVEVKNLRFGVLQGYVLEGLYAHVAAAFSSALALLSRSGAHLEEVTFSSLDEIPLANQKGGFAAAEAYPWHRSLLETHASEYDPRIASRILRGKEMTRSGLHRARAGAAQDHCRGGPRSRSLRCDPDAYCPLHRSAYCGSRGNGCGVLRRQCDDSAQSQRDQLFWMAALSLCHAMPRAKRRSGS